MYVNHFQFFILYSGETCDWEQRVHWVRFQFFILYSFPIRAARYEKAWSFQFFILYSVHRAATPYHQYLVPFNSLYCILVFYESKTNETWTLNSCLSILYIVFPNSLWLRALVAGRYYLSILYIVFPPLQAQIAELEQKLGFQFFILYSGLTYEWWVEGEETRLSILYIVFFYWRLTSQRIKEYAFNSLYCILNENFYLSFLILCSIFI